VAFDADGFGVALHGDTGLHGEVPGLDGGVKVKRALFQRRQLPHFAFRT
jgi:hypothetical protein